MMKMHQTKFITAINWKRNNKKKVFIKVMIAPSCENKSKKMLLRCYATEKYGV